MNKKTIISTADFPITTQISLLFETMPFDITYINEENIVVYYNHETHRPFKRSPEIIGKSVFDCHLPESIPKVKKVIDTLREGTENEISYCIEKDKRKIWIRYLAVRNAKNHYCGILEVSQDITNIEKIKEI